MRTAKAAFLTERESRPAVMLQPEATRSVVEGAENALLRAALSVPGMRRACSPLWNAPGDYASLDPGVITIRVLWRWWAWKGLNPGPRDYESERSPESAARYAPGDYDPLVQEL